MQFMYDPRRMCDTCCVEHKMNPAGKTTVSDLPPPPPPHPHPPQRATRALLAKFAACGRAPLVGVYMAHSSSSGTRPLSLCLCESSRWVLELIVRRAFVDERETCIICRHQPGYRYYIPFGTPPPLPHNMTGVTPSTLFVRVHTPLQERKAYYTSTYPRQSGEPSQAIRNKAANIARGGSIWEKPRG